MRSIVILGPDRVGKTTALRNTEVALVQGGYKVKTLHFSGILPTHHSPVEQFVTELKPLDTDCIDYLLIDRFVPDTLFYEPHRGKMSQISWDCAAEAESLLIGMSSRIDVIIIERKWDEEVKDRHMAELEMEYPGSSAYWRNSQIELREEEHNLYYEEVWEFFLDTSIIPKKSIHYVRAMPGDDPSRHIFSMCPGIPV